MKALLIGGWKVWLLNRRNRSAEFDGNIHFIQADIRHLKVTNSGEF